MELNLVKVSSLEAMVSKIPKNTGHMSTTPDDTCTNLTSAVPSYDFTILRVMNKNCMANTARMSHIDYTHTLHTDHL